MDRVGFWRLLAAGDWRRVVVGVVSLALVVMIATTLARLVWLVVDGPVQMPPPSGVTTVAQVAAPAPRYTPDTASGWRLFGEAVPGDAAPTGENAPATSLSLQLLGTFSSGDVRLAGAVIGERGKDGELYRIGATLPGGAVLEKVDADKVLLRRRGQLETLAFDKLSYSGGGSATEAGGGLDMAGGFRNVRERLQPPAEEGGVDTDPQSRARAVLNSLSENLRSNPEGVLSELGLRPVSGSQASGYVVGEGTNGDVMRSLGLRPGDIVLSVNGKPLGQVRNDARMIDEVKASGEARVDIRRGAQTFTVNYPL